MYGSVRDKPELCLYHPLFVGMHKLFKVTYHITDYVRYVFTEISHSTMTTGNGKLVDKNFDGRDLENHLVQSFP